MSSTKNDPPSPLSAELLLSCFLEGAKPKTGWKVGMELEKMGRDARTGHPLPYGASEARAAGEEGPTVRKVLEFLQSCRGGDPVLESGNLIGLSAPWGAISLEPGGQVEWSSEPQSDLQTLERALQEHLTAMREAGSTLGIEWLDLAVDPKLPVTGMSWMPKARYGIMRDYLARRGRLAHRMMTQTASIQCAYDFADVADWKRKFRTAAFLAPVATALFANSSIVDGTESGYVSYRQTIWRETDPDRCGLPPVVFTDTFDIEHWIDYILDVPTFFLRRDGRLVATDGVPFRRLITDSEKLGIEDWATHVSTIFTDIRACSYIEVRCADLLPDDRAFAVPTFWTGTLYDDEALEAAQELGHGLDGEGWSRAMLSAARQGLDGKIGRFGIREAAERAVTAAVRGLAAGAPCAGDPSEAVRPLERLADHLGLEIRP